MAQLVEAKALADLAESYLPMSLRAGLLAEEAVFRQLSAATNDTAVRDVLFQKPGGFRLAH